MSKLSIEEQKLIDYMKRGGAALFRGVKAQARENAAEKKFIAAVKAGEGDVLRAVKKKARQDAESHNSIIMTAGARDSRYTGKARPTVVNYSRGKDKKANKSEPPKLYATTLLTE